MGDWESELVRRCASGDAAALEVLYRRYVDRVWRYGKFRTRSSDAAAEIVQETFLRVARSAKQFEGRSSFGTWLFAIARSVTIQYQRRQRREISSPEGTVFRLNVGVEPGTEGVEGETRDRVRTAIGALPGAQRDAVVLCELLGLSIREAAEVLSWGESRVKVTLFRARRRLRELLKDHVAGESVMRNA